MPIIRNVFSLGIFYSPLFGKLKILLTRFLVNMDPAHCLIVEITNRKMFPMNGCGLGSGGIGCLRGCGVGGCGGIGLG